MNKRLIIIALLPLSLLAFKCNLDGDSCTQPDMQDFSFQCEEECKPTTAYYVDTARQCVTSQEIVLLCEKKYGLGHSTAGCLVHVQSGVYVYISSLYSHLFENGWQMCSTEDKDRIVGYCE